MEKTVTSSASGNVIQPEKVGAYQRQTLWSSVIGYAMDGLDMMLLAFVLPLIIGDFHLTTAAAGGISTITMFGVVIGGITFGILADRCGRVKVFTWTILIFSLFTGLSALAPSDQIFVGMRFLAGLGLGGEFGIGMTLVSESWPTKLRTKATSWVALGYQGGTLLATLLASYVSGHFGWRGVFAIGILPALLAWWTRRNLEEPAMWVENRRMTHKGFPMKALFANRRVTLTTIGLIILTSVQNLGYFGIMNWMPTMLATQRHATISGTIFWTLSTLSGMVIGIIVFAWAADKFGRKPAFITFQISAAIIVWIYFQITSPVLLVALGSVLGFFVNGMMGGYGALLSEHYPTAIRSTAENLIFNLGRFIGGFSPLFIGLLALHGSLSAALGMISGIYILAALAMLLLIPETKGEDLEAIEAE
ncbi:MFS transporter [Oenococcus sp.]|uniref:MFS transporter n=1 Tax=Oenococcus sp. TaxID=1979414 RepID=UPI0039E8868D